MPSAAAQTTRVLAHVANNGGGVSVLDTATNALTTALVDNQGDSPYGVGVAFDGARAFVTNSEGDTLSVLDLANRTPVTTIRVGDRPISVALTPDGAKAYVTNSHGNSLSIVDTATLAVEATIPVGVNPVGIAIHAVPPARTRLTGGTGKIVNRGGLTVTGITATLTESHTGRPVAGKLIDFRTVKGSPLCAATTNALGAATCDSRVPFNLGVNTLLEGYTAAFGGDTHHGPSAVHGAITRR
ncbi:hypothetical protein [Saccharothrix sp.]|uniref:YncE family protein n=1 Tax=Saccharothrix sp. TaxID=1873460 RepID=UPI00281163F8|nr:hypothetical protein [Saccharothrix sp.]